MIKIETQRTYMRQIQENDWSLFERLHQEEEVIRYAFDRPSDEEIRQRFESRLPKWQWGATHWLCLVIEDKVSGESIGVTGLCIPDGCQSCVEVGYLLLPEHHGHGYGTESLVALVDYIEAHFPVKDVSAIVTDGNVASCKVLEKSGFEFVSRDKDAYQIGGKSYDDLLFRYTISY